jgi:hypothetical protein
MKRYEQSYDEWGSSHKAPNIFMSKRNLQFSDVKAMKEEFGNRYEKVPFA